MQYCTNVFFSDFFKSENVSDGQVMVFGLALSEILTRANDNARTETVSTAEPLYSTGERHRFIAVVEGLVGDTVGVVDFHFLSFSLVLTNYIHIIVKSQALS